MIQRRIQTVEVSHSNSSRWQEELVASKISTRDLLAKLELSDHSLADSGAESLFDLRVPPYFLSKIQKGNPNDPLLLQVLPQNAEFLSGKEYVGDPLEEADASPVPGLIHKYKSRVLFITTQACAINCRYCFRRNFPYREHRPEDQWNQAIEYIRTQKSVNEVILSGGDPLVLKDEKIAQLLRKLDEIPQIVRIRIHTRLLTSLPNRITSALLATLANLSCKIVFVTHCNHAQELGEEVAKACKALQAIGVTILNQSVLLKDINDNADTLMNLSESLFAHGILPYYLFTLDKVMGAEHFDMPHERAHKIYQTLAEKLPGFLLPKLASEIPGRSSKTTLGTETRAANRISD